MPLHRVFDSVSTLPAAPGMEKQAGFLKRESADSQFLKVREQDEFFRLDGNTRQKGDVFSCSAATVPNGKIVCLQGIFWRKSVMTL